MSLDFGKWLKDIQQTQTKCVCCNFPNLHIPIINVSNLGEQAWSMYLLNVEKKPDFKENQLNHWWYTGKEEVWYDIAVGCLGKVEVEERLKRGVSHRG